MLWLIQEYSEQLLAAGRLLGLRVLLEIPSSPVSESPSVDSVALWFLTFDSPGGGLYVSEGNTHTLMLLCVCVHPHIVFVCVRGDMLYVDIIYVYGVCMHVVCVCECVWYACSVYLHV